MKQTRVMYLIITTFLLAHFANAQERLSKEEWQQEVQKYTKMRDEAKEKVGDLVKQSNSLEAEAVKLDNDQAGCLEALYALVGSNTVMAETYAGEITAVEGTANELLRLPDSEIAAREGVVKGLDQKVKNLWSNPLSVIPDFNTRLTALNGQTKTLMGKLVPGERTFTVGTWSGDGACLWKIADQVYGNPFQWPKIWVKNRQEIKNPDIIQPGQQLRIPVAGELTQEERAAVQSHYNRKLTK